MKCHVYGKTLEKEMSCSGILPTLMKKKCFVKLVPVPADLHISSIGWHYGGFSGNL